MKRDISHSKRGLITAIVTISFLFLFISSPSLANPVKKGQAQKAARGWLKQNRNPMDCLISDIPAKAGPLIGEDGKTLCYIVNLEPAGFVIVSADDEIEPVIAFSSTGYFNGNENSPLTTLLRKDMTARLEAVKQKPRSRNDAEKLHKWDMLIGTDTAVQADSPDMIEMGIPSVSQVWVDPLTQTEWNQEDVLGSPCYNYYTPNNHPTGCVATAMAQVMRYHSWPTTGIGVESFNITVDGVSQTASTRGGDGFGGVYNWSEMPYVPSSGVTTTQRQAIGALCYDAGVSVNMSYSSGGSSASLADADQEMTGTFNYSNSIYTRSFTSSGDSRLWNLLNANLDAEFPVMLSIDGDGGHAVVADGYGYTGETLYHHINMGWGGSDNAWYQLPLIDASYTFNVIKGAVYNIYTSGSGEIISGRVTNLAGAPLADVSVKAYIGTTLKKQATTNSRGVYALQNLSSNTTYRISAIKSGENFLDQNVATGNSTDWGTPGNRSGILFVSANAGPPTAFDVEVDVDSTDIANIQFQVLDDGDPDPNLMQYIIMSLPLHGDLSEPNVGPIDTVPYIVLVADANSGVDYTPCPYFGGQDTFTYKANDGGTYPVGGDSNIATVTVNVNNQLYSDFGTSSNTYLYGMMMNTRDFYDTRSQVIYLSSEVGSAKRLTDLSLRIGQVPGRPLNNWTIRMKHTNKTYFQSSAYELETSGWTTVYQANDTMSPTGWIDFHFSTPFDYNGTQNLMIDFSYNNTGITAPYGGYFIQDVSNNRVYSVASDTGTHGDPLNWGDYFGKYYSLHNSLPSIKLIGIPPVNPLMGDFDATCDVKLSDLVIFSQAWQASSADANYDVQCDLTSTKGDVDIQDLIILANQWLKTYP